MPRQTITLVTTGRRTGQERPATLYAFPDGDRLVVVGSRGGAAKDPAWAANLRARPRATVHHGKAAHAVHAHEVEGDERDRLWDLVTTEFPMYRSFQKRTRRLIPVFVLAPAADG